MGKKSRRKWENRAAQQGGQLIGHLIHERSITITAGPLPPAEQLQQYEQIHRGAAGILFEEFQAQGRHRRKIESRVSFGNTTSQWGGLIAGTAICLYTISKAFQLLQAGRNIEGMGALVLALGALAAGFIGGLRQNTRKFAEKIVDQAVDAVARRFAEQHNPPHTEQPSLDSRDQTSLPLNDSRRLNHGGSGDV